METHENRKRIQTDLLMLLVAFIWGSAFTAQQMAAASVKPFLVLGIRFTGAALLLLILVRFRLQIPKQAWWKIFLVGGLLFAASAFQQAALSVSSVGNAGFITGMYVVFIPILLSLFWRQGSSWNVWAAVVLVAIGLWLLTNTGPAKFQTGDVLLLVCAVLYALQMIFLSQLVRAVDPIHVAAGQFLVCGALGLAFGILLEENTVMGVTAALGPLLYITVFSTTIAYTLQGVAQKTADPTDAAIFLSLESVFAALVGAVLLKEVFNTTQIIGCGLMFAAMVLSQVTVKLPGRAAVPAGQRQTQSPGIGHAEIDLLDPPAQG